MHIQNTLLRLKTATANAFSHPASFVGFAALTFIMPLVMIIIGGKEPNQLPWFFWAIVLIGALGVISIGFMKFTHESFGAKALTIRPDRKSAAVGKTQ